MTNQQLMDTGHIMMKETGQAIERSKQVMVPKIQSDRSCMTIHWKIYHTQVSRAS